ncbi:hypothetical protein [Nitrospirillum amazonense]|uniref:hypothetical protein n=1 Tax=Nitrospirillum amazonense TaxID=28077 RepID=UPI0024126048|nr:hypothetical protein [Nitrospirillum amazonense]MDG3442441.1 hypothetical protein [Nitrospirillum amazonense]
MSDLDAPYAALFALLEALKAPDGEMPAAGQVVTASRDVQLFEQVPADKLPALFLAVDHQVYQYQMQGVPATARPSAKIYLYAAADDTLSAGQRVNGLLGAVMDVLKPTGAYADQTLGGLVQYARIEGTVEVYDGVLTRRAAAIVPVKMLVP